MLNDGTRTVELYHVADSHHTDTFLMVYLPKEKLLIEADSFTPARRIRRRRHSSTRTTRTWSTTSRLNFPVDKILPLHGRVVPATDLYVAVGQSPPK